DLAGRAPGYNGPRGSRAKGAALCGSSPPLGRAGPAPDRLRPGSHERLGRWAPAPRPGQSLRWRGHGPLADCEALPASAEPWRCPVLEPGLSDRAVPPARAAPIDAAPTQP